MKDRVIAVGFVLILIIVFIINIIVKDEVVSTTERRKLAQFSSVTESNIMGGDLSEKFETYAVDQFIGRDFFRSLKSFCSINVFRQKDNNELFLKNDAIYKMEYKLKPDNIERSASKLKEIYEKYLEGMNVYYAIIPEKNYYLEHDDHLKMDYQQLQEIMEQQLKDIKYIDISSSLDIEDYYRTDLHWKQENLQDVVKKLESEMKLDNSISSKYSIKNMGKFYGVYYGQLGIEVPADTLYILTNDDIENCITYNFETQKYGKIYDEKTSADRYDIYLSGAVPLITIENPNAKVEKELLLFRDSFGSSIAPLLMENYSKITLIDIRYISSKILEQYIDFNNQDVLFLYSTTVLNQNIFR